MFDDSTEDVRDFFEENGGDWPVIVGDEGDIALDYGVPRCPSRTSSRPTARCVAKIIGGVTADGLEELLDAVQARSSGERGGVLVASVHGRRGRRRPRRRHRSTTGAARTAEDRVQAIAVDHPVPAVPQPVGGRLRRADGPGGPRRDRRADRGRARATTRSATTSPAASARRSCSPRRRAASARWCGSSRWSPSSLGGAGLGLAFRRWRRLGREPATGDERRAFLERSLADLDDEHAAGDLTTPTTPPRAPTTSAGWPPSTSPGRRPRRAPRRRRSPMRGRARRSPSCVVVGVAAGHARGRSRRAARRRRHRSPAASSPADGPAGDGPATTATTLPDRPGRLLRPRRAATAFDCYIGYTRANPDDPDGFLYFGLFAVNQGLEADRAELLDGGETLPAPGARARPRLRRGPVNLAVVLERTGRDDEARAELTPSMASTCPPMLQALVDFVRRNLDEAATTSTTAP